MSGAKDVRVAPITSEDARRIVRREHYSGKVVNNSQLHFGVFLDGRLEGAMQFGPSLDKSKVLGLVRDTPWNGFIELNRMAFSERLPRNSESRALSIAFRLIRKHYPHLQWVISFADGTQSGDGTIYRASGFVLTGIKRNTQIWEAPSGEVFNDTSIRPGIGGKRERERKRANAVFSRLSLTDPACAKQQQQAKTLCRGDATKGPNVLDTGASSMRVYAEAGFRPKAGFQLRYIYFLDPTARTRLTVPEIPFSRIDEMGAGMYRGVACTRPKQASEGTTLAAVGQRQPGRSEPTQTSPEPPEPPGCP